MCAYGEIKISKHRWLTWPFSGARNLDEAIVERQTVSDRVLPALLVLTVEREQVHDELIDLVERTHASR